MGGELIDLNMENQEKPIPMFNLVEPEEIQYCSCIQIIQTAYYFINNYLCQECYDNLDPVERDFYRIPPNHYLSGKAARTRVSHCNTCGINIAKQQPAIFCTQCINVYVNLNQFEKTLLNGGVMTRTVAYYNSQ
jgi:hypothetical protein